MAKRTALLDSDPFLAYAREPKKAFVELDRGVHIVRGEAYMREAVTHRNAPPCSVLHF
jgi:hypothetical protein